MLGTSDVDRVRAGGPARRPRLAVRSLAAPGVPCRSCPAPAPAVIQLRIAPEPKAIGGAPAGGGGGFVRPAGRPLVELVEERWHAAVPDAHRQRHRRDGFPAARSLAARRCGGAGMIVRVTPRGRRSSDRPVARATARLTRVAAHRLAHPGGGRRSAGRLLGVVLRSRRRDLDLVRLAGSAMGMVTVSTPAS
jgi:hypothetical protein